MSQQERGWIMRERVREAQESHPIPEELKDDLMWAICNENAKQFQGVPIKKY